MKKDFEKKIIILTIWKFVDFIILFLMRESCKYWIKINHFSLSHFHLNKARISFSCKYSLTDSLTDQWLRPASYKQLKSCPRIAKSNTRRFVHPTFTGRKLYDHSHWSHQTGNLISEIEISNIYFKYLKVLLVLLQHHLWN